jgi:hypothetical protein
MLLRSRIILPGSYNPKWPTISWAEPSQVTESRLWTPWVHSGKIWQWHRIFQSRGQWRWNRLVQAEQIGNRPLGSFTSKITIVDKLLQLAMALIRSFISCYIFFAHVPHILVQITADGFRYHPKLLRVRDFASSVSEYRRICLILQV